MARTTIVTTGMVVAAVSATLCVGPSAQGTGTDNDGKREYTLSGCLLRNGYAGYQMENVTIEAIDGKPAPEALTTLLALKKWTLQGGGNLGPRVGEKVQVVGRSDWRDGPAAQADEPPKPPSLDVKSLKTVAPSC